MYFYLFNEIDCNKNQKSNKTYKIKSQATELY